MELAPREMTRNILRYYRATRPEHIEAGLVWYPKALAECERHATESRSGATLEQAVAALSHLSPRAKWEQNLRALRALLDGRTPPPGTFSRSWDMALAASLSDDPLSTFSNRALKTRDFARAILGDRQAVAIDIWAGRIAGVQESAIRRRPVYNAVADAYRRAAAIEHLAPREMQAITWCHIRGQAD
jgi:hypothetical protein